MKSATFKILMIVCFFTGVCLSLSGQTLLTYGNDEVSRAEFLKAYQKNNTDKKPTEQLYRNYLDLYIRYKLKVKAALDARYDTLPNQVTELKNFRAQVVDGYMKDDASLNKIVDEAFTRGLKDIHLAQLFIAFPKNATPADTLKAFQKAALAIADLKKGKPFEEVALIYSDDPAVKNNHGDIGYITVFTLPYELETLAYSIPAGQYSKTFRGGGGYHIFKNLGERNAIGKIKAAQILLTFPPNATDAMKAAVAHKADSFYTLLSNGADFATLAKQYSGDNLSYQNGGDMVPFGAGKFDAAFEKAAFALDKDGAISKPVLTAFGYHIIKRESREPVPTVNNKQSFELYRQKVMNDPRMAYSRKTMLQKILKDIHYRKQPVNEISLWVYTDSFLHRAPAPKLAGIDDKTVLFSFEKTGTTIKDWLDYIKPIKPASQKSDEKKNREYLDQYLQTAAFKYYRDHLEAYNKDFAYQLKELKEGNLLFEIMQRKIWDKASADSVGLKNYYDAHKEKYHWEPSADALLFTCNNEKIATDIQQKIKQQDNNWKKIIDSSAGMAQADSGRFEMAQLPMASEKNFTAGSFSSMTSNQNDHTVTFAYIIKIYPERSPRNYTDARGFVINDYQASLEDNWIAELKKKYPVRVNEAVVKSLPK